MQFLLFGQPDEVARIDRNHDTILIHGTAPNGVIRLANQSAIAYMINVMPRFR